MRRLFVKTLVVAVAAAGLLGVAQRAVADGNDASNASAARALGGGDATFKLTVNPADFGLAQGNKREVKISVARDADFKGKIKVTLEPSKGLTVDPEERVLEASDTSFNATITAADDAAPGKHEIKVVGRGGGKIAELTVDVAVKKGTGTTDGSGEATFKLSVDPAEFNLNQGGEREVTVSVSRDKNFKEPITVALKSGKGLSTDPDDKVLETSDTSFKATIRAGDDAAPGKHEIKVVGKGGGFVAKVDVVVTVKAGLDSDRTFTLTADPGQKISLKQGEEQEVKISVSRGKNLKGPITVVLHPSKGLTAKPHENVLEANETNFTATVAAADDAAPGKHEVKVVGKGGDLNANVTIPVEVEKGLDPDKTFKLSADPAEEFNLKQGEERKVKITVSRGKDFKGPITVTLKSGKGLTANPNQEVLEGDQTSFNTTIVAGNDAPLGKHEVKAIGKGGGLTARVTIAVDVKDKDGKGKDNDGKKDNVKGGGDKAASFKLNVNPADFNLAQGNKREIKISVTRDKGFTDKITVKFKTAEGLTVDPDERVLEDSDTSFNATITAAKDAATGKHEFKVIAHGGGKSAEVGADVTVKAK